mmetsp:Transcript_11867/g.29728  ORF Transcript_11867/g.29728 Transcript_11867/m.29728 type:complete len:328 (+) Transcript_11867:179-1162(+)
MVTHSHSLVLSNHNLALSRTQFSHDNPPIIHVAVWESCHCGEEDVITPLRRAVLVWPYSVERILGIPCASTRLVAALTTRGLERHPRISEAPIQKALVVVGRCLGACVEVSNNDAGVSLFMGLVRRFKRLLNLTLPYRIRPRVLWIDRAPCRCVQVDHAHYPRPLRRQLQVYHKLPLVCQQPLQRRSLPVCLKPDTRDRVLGQDHEAIVEPCGKQSSRASGGIPSSVWQHVGQRLFDLFQVRLLVTLLQTHDVWPELSDGFWDLLEPLQNVGGVREHLDTKQPETQQPYIEGEDAEIRGWREGLVWHGLTAKGENRISEIVQSREID